MKKISTILLTTFLASLLVNQSLLAQYSSTTVQTPRNETVDALTYYGSPYDTDEINHWNDWWTDNWDVVILEDATPYYNCHAFAWHIVDGGNVRWINDIDGSYNPLNNVTKYYSGSNATYVQVGSNYREGLKVSYLPRDHSAITTNTPGVLISKWSYGPKVRHNVAETDFYSGATIKYYEVPLTGSDLVCSSSSQTYSTLNISGAAYSWSGNNMSISGSTYSVSASRTTTGASGSVQVNISSPYSSTTVNARKSMWLGTAVVTGITVNTSMCTGYSQVVVASTAGNPSALSWYVSSGNSSNAYLTDYGGGSAYFNSYIPDCYGLTINLTNGCGPSTDGTTICVDNCLSAYKVYPNPAEDYINVQFENFKAISVLPEQIDLYSEISQKAVVSFGKDQIWKSMTSSGVFQISVKELPRGTYYLHTVSDSSGEQKNKVRFVLR